MVNCVILTLEYLFEGDNMANAQKVKILKEHFEQVKDCFIHEDDSEILYTVADDIIVPMLTLDEEEGIKMWEYVLVHYYDQCCSEINSVCYNTITDHIVEESEPSTLVSVFKKSDIVKKYVFLLNPYPDHLNSEWFVNDAILLEEYELADELISLYIQNTVVENNPQENLFSLLYHAITSSDSRWKMKSAGIDLIHRWIPKITSSKKRTQLQTALLKLIDCVEGNAPKGGMPLKMFMEEGGMQRLLEDKQKRNSQIRSPSTIKGSTSFDKFMEDRSQKQKKQVKIVNVKNNQDNISSTNIAIDESALNTAKEELNSLIGLNEVKEEVNGLINLIKMRQLRTSRGLKSPTTSQHLVFIGNPGTGKTTVARIIGKIYHALGFLSKGHLIEVDRSGLVAGYIGQTALKTQGVIQSALGGILFIDEAYTLAPENTNNDFGPEAIDTILKAMEDNRNDFVVIVAGYDNLMPRFINSNPGLKSRFNKYINFPDYDEKELHLIFHTYLRKNDYHISQKADKYIKTYLNSLYTSRDDNFGNARDVRNLFEKIVSAQANRVVTIKNPTNNDIITITIDDVKEVIENNCSSVAEEMCNNS